LDSGVDAREPEARDYTRPPCLLHGIPRPFKITSIREERLGEAGFLEVEAVSLNGLIGGWEGPPQFALLASPGLCEDKAPILEAGNNRVLIAVSMNSVCAKQLSDAYILLKLPLGRRVSFKEGRTALIAESKKQVVWLAPFSRRSRGHMVVFAPKPREIDEIIGGGGIDEFIVAGSVGYLREMAGVFIANSIDPLMIADTQVKCGLGLCGSCLIEGTGLLACVEGPGLRASLLIGGDRR